MSITSTTLANEVDLKLTIDYPDTIALHAGWAANYPLVQTDTRTR